MLMIFFGAGIMCYGNVATVKEERYDKWTMLPCFAPALYRQRVYLFLLAGSASPTNSIDSATILYQSIHNRTRFVCVLPALFTIALLAFLPALLTSGYKISS